MTKPIAISSKPVHLNTLYLLLLAITLGCAGSARILDEVDPQPPIPADTPDDVAGPTTTTTSPTVLPNSAAPVAAPVATSAPDADADDTTPASAAAPVATSAPDADTDNTTPASAAAPVATSTPDTDVDNTAPASAANVAPIATPVVATSPPGPTSSSTAATVAEHPSLSFFMHDILGGTTPSGRAVTGIVTNSDANNLPFSKPNNQVIPINGGIPLNTLTTFLNNNNNNVPFLVGLNGQTSSSSTIIQNSGNNNIVNNDNNLPFVSAGQLPAGLTLQQLMFGSITVVDNELTEGHELGSAVLGSAQGFYLSSSLDGTSHTLVLTALFHGGHDQHEVDDTISFFGIHRTASPESQLAVIGGTGKYEDAKGYATILTLPQHDQHTTDGVETITQFNVYLTA